MTYNPKFKKKVYTHRRVAELKAMPKPEGQGRFDWRA